jgi:hypothetical protein
MSDGVELFSYNDSFIDNWRPGTEFVRPKWGIYRSLNDADALRDEEVLFNDFSILELVSPIKQTSLDLDVVIVNPLDSSLNIQQIPSIINRIQVFDINGNVLIDEKTINRNQVNFDISTFTSGMYIVLLMSEKGVYSKLVVKH